MRTPTKTWSAAQALCLALTLGILMSACTTPAPGPRQTSSFGVKNPHEALDGRRVSPSQGLKNAAAEAYKLHGGILGRVDPSLFNGNYSLPTSRRMSSETPACKDGNSYWYLNTLSFLKSDVDTEAVFTKMKNYLESQGYTMTQNGQPGSDASFDFRKDDPVEVVSLAINKSEKSGQIGLRLVTADFPNPPESEWPKPGEEETWKPSVPLWPAGLGPKETASPTP